MTEKEEENVRVGYGRSNWHFDNERTILADRLTISIELMVVLAPEFAIPILDWVSRLPYPWCDSETMLLTMPSLDSLIPVREQIA